MLVAIVFLHHENQSLCKVRWLIYNSEVKFPINELHENDSWTDRIPFHLRPCCYKYVRGKMCFPNSTLLLKQQTFISVLTSAQGSTSLDTMRLLMWMVLNDVGEVVLTWRKRRIVREQDLLIHLKFMKQRNSTKDFPAFIENPENEELNWISLVQQRLLYYFSGDRSFHRTFLIHFSIASKNIVSFVLIWFGVWFWRYLRISAMNHEGCEWKWPTIWLLSQNYLFFYAYFS